MARDRQRRLGSGLLLTLAFPLVAGGQVVRLGGELQINTFTTTSQSSPAIATEADGDFIVAWYSYHTGNGTDVFARRFSSAGTPLGSELLVNSHTSGLEFSPAVAISASGDFVIAWESRDQDGSTDGNFARRFSSAGVPLGVEFQVTTYTSSYQDLPAVAAAPSGDFVIVWHSRYQDGSEYGVFAQRFSSAGAFLASEFQVNTYTENDQRDPTVATMADGDFVVAWNSDGQDGAEEGIFARRFTSAGVAQASELQVNAHTTSAQHSPSVASAAEGDFIVVWQSDTQDGSAYGVFGRRISSAGQKLGVELQVNVYTAGDQRNPTVAADPSGGFVVAWQSLVQDGSSLGIFGRRFTSNGAPASREFQLNTYTASAQYNPVVAGDSGDDFVVAWQSAGQDGSGSGVFAQRFTEASSLDIDGDGSTDPLTDGLLTLRYLFGFHGATLITGAVGSGCTRCDAPSIEAYLAGLTN